MNNTKAAAQSNTSHLILFVFILPLLFIAGVQLFILSAQTETYFAWTFTAPLSAAFLGAGYWAAMFYAAQGMRARGWAYLRSSMPAALTAVVLLTVTTFLHLDRFHLYSPLFITRFVTWVWIVVYVAASPLLAIFWIIQSRLPGAGLRGNDPLPAWLRAGYTLLAVFALACGIGLFLVPQSMAAFWPWGIMPLAARSIGAWMSAFGVACAALVFENDIRCGAGTSSSLFAFCILQLIVVARYASALDWGRPLTIGYMIFLILGALIAGANLVRNRR
ncbi:MAG: hypothetical protein WCC12_18220 [Anaerolineales bacterium]